MNRTPQPVVHTLVFLSLLAALFGAYPTATAWAAGSAGLPVHSSHSAGPVTIHDYGVQHDPARGSLSSPLMSPNTWNALGAGLNGAVNTIVVAGGYVYAGGNFTDAGGDPNADYIARWDGSSWSALGTTPLSGVVNSIAVYGSDLFVGGSFSNAGGDPNADYVAQWDGSTWSALGDGLNAAVNSIGVSGSNIYVAGSFTDAGVDPNADYIAKLDGGTWEALGATPLSATVATILVSGAVVYAGGNFQNAGGDPNADDLAVWDGTTWSSLGSAPFNGTVNAIALDGSDLYVGGGFFNAAGNPNADFIAMWNGSSWSAVGNSNMDHMVNAILVDGADIYVGGLFGSAGGVANSHKIAKWDGSSWSAVGGGLGASAFCFALSGTSLYVGGAFSGAGGNANANFISRYDIDVTAPTVASFTASSPSSSDIIPVTAFTATDDAAVSAYLITQSATPPLSGAAGWTSSVPTTYTVGSDGSYTLYPWAKDSSNNISAVYNTPASVIVDTTAPTVTAFTVSTPSASLVIPVGAFSASDAVGVTGYLITQSSTPPSASDPGWTASAPTSYTVASDGSYTLYPWVRDAAGNVSAAYGSPAGATVDTTAPTVNSFSATSPSNSFNIPITAFTASDSSGVSAYLITESATPPDAGDPNWSALAPNTYSVGSNGTYTLYPWAEDVVGNVSAVYGSPLTVSVDVNKPAVSAFTATTPATSHTITIPSFTASDNVAVTGYLITESSTPPQPNALGWTASAPGSYTVGADGNFTLYPWARDAAGNVSTAFGSPRSVHVDSARPSVTSFTATSPATSHTITITAFSATDNLGVSGYLVTQNSTPPSAGAAGWTASAPGSYTVSSDGNYTLYPWAKDAAGNVSLAYSSPASVAVDTAAPTVDSFTATSPSNSLDIPITDFSASDAVGVSGYLITQSTTPPSAGDAGWTVSAPTSYTVGSEGSYTLYPWARDAVGNVSAVYGSPAGVSVDTTAPAVTSFAATSPSNSLAIPITDFGASDAGGVTGYLITQSATPPLPGDAGWTASAPTTYMVGSDGPYTLYPWALDGAGNVSAVYGSPASVSVDSTAPAVSAFTATSPSASLTIPITAFSASDAVGVTGYLITGSATVPSVGDAGWTASAPTSYIVGADGAYTLYPWAKDAAGNVSAVYGSPAGVSVDTTAPSVVSITRASANPTDHATVQFTVNFSEPVSGLDTSDFSLTAAGPSGAFVRSVSSSSGSTFTVSINTGLGNGSLRLDIPASATITDPAGNALSNTPYTGGDTYTVNKMLTFHSTAAQDGWVLETSENSNIGGALNSTATTLNLGDDAGRKQYLGILSFNTASLPDGAAITSVMLKVKKSAIVGGGNPVSLFQGFMIDIKKGLFGTAALQASDFQTGASKTYGPINAAAVNNWYSLNLTSGKAYVNTLATNGGLTQIRLRFKLDDNNNAIANYLSIFSGNAPTASAPQLVITYYEP